MKVISSRTEFQKNHDYFRLGKISLENYFVFQQITAFEKDIRIKYMRVK